MKATVSSLVSSDITFFRLVVRHNFLPIGGHQDKPKQLSYVIIYCLQENIEYNLPLLIIWNIIVIASRGVKSSLSYGWCSPVFSKNLEDQTSLKHCSVDELTFGKMGDESACSAKHGQLKWD